MKGEVTSYLIELENKSTIQRLTLPNDTMKYNLTNLQPYTEYSVRVKAISPNKKDGLLSNWINVKTVIAGMLSMYNEK
jgi:hypothetical protein